MEKDWRQHGLGFGRFLVNRKGSPASVQSLSLACLPRAHGKWKRAVAKEYRFHLCIVPPYLTKLFWTKLASVHHAEASSHLLCVSRCRLARTGLGVSLEGSLCLIAGKEGGTRLVWALQWGGSAFLLLDLSSTSKQNHGTTNPEGRGRENPAITFLGALDFFNLCQRSS